MRAVLERAATKRGEVLGGPSASASQLQRDVMAALRRLQKRQQEQQQTQGAPWPAPEPQPAESNNSAAAPRIIGVQHEASVPALCCRVGILVQLSDGRVVAVEVDGPTHFLCNTSFKCTKSGSTVLRDRQLGRVFGQDNVVSVPYLEWDALRGNKAAQEQYVGAAGGE